MKTAKDYLGLSISFTRMGENTVVCKVNNNAFMRPVVLYAPAGEGK